MKKIYKIKISYILGYIITFLCLSLGIPFIIISIKYEYYYLIIVFIFIALICLLSFCFRRYVIKDGFIYKYAFIVYKKLDINKLEYLDIDIGNNLKYIVVGYDNKIIRIVYETYIEMIKDGIVLPKIPEKDIKIFDEF